MSFTQEPQEQRTLKLHPLTPHSHTRTAIRASNLLPQYMSNIGIQKKNTILFISAFGCNSKVSQDKYTPNVPIFSQHSFEKTQQSFRILLRNMNFGLEQCTWIWLMETIQAWPQNECTKKLSIHNTFPTFLNRNTDSFYFYYAAAFPLEEQGGSQMSNFLLHNQ